MKVDRTIMRPGLSFLTLAVSCFAFAVTFAQTSLNVSLYGTLNPVPIRYSGSWGWTSPTGNEYALLGGFEGTHVIAIDDSTNIFEAGFVDGPNSNWREITVVGDHAFVVSEGSGTLQGMQVISLSPLPDSVHLVTTYTATFTRGHIIMRDISTEEPFVYVSGTSATGGVHMIDISDPANPVQRGLYDPGYYIHDAHVRDNLLFASALGQGLDIVDISDKSSPAIISRIEHPSQFTHSAWTTPDLSYVVVTDEVDGLPARIWNISNLDDPFEVAQYSANLQSLVHNSYVLEDLVFMSHNTEGLRVVDIADPTVPVEVGYYDTYPGPSGGFNGLWSAYPYFPSGKIIGGNREDGLYVWKFNGTRAGRIYGTVTDSATGKPVGDAVVAIIEADRSTFTLPDGSFSLGSLPSGTEGYTITASAPMHDTVSMTGVLLDGGAKVLLDFQLPPEVINTADESETPTEQHLVQNHPNPFNSISNFEFRIAKLSYVSLMVYDALGREVATLVNERLSPGIHQRRWDATGQPSGVYFYRLTAGDYVATRKLIILK